MDDVGAGGDGRGAGEVSAICCCCMASQPAFARLPAFGIALVGGFVSWRARCGGTLGILRVGGSTVCGDILIAGET